MQLSIALLFSAAVTLSAQTTPAPVRQDQSQPGTEYQIPRDARRDPWQKPDQVIGALKFSASETVAVIESGYPYFPQRIAPLVKKVYAVNTDPRAFRGRGTLPVQISPIVATSDDPHISRLNIDTVMIVDVLASLPHRSSYYVNVVAGLKPGSRLVVINRKLPFVYPAFERLTDTDIEAEVPTAGFTFVEQFTFLAYQYFIVFRL
jgi:hypothetical protein